MNIDTNKSTYKPPYSVVLLDAMDAYYYADIMGKMKEVATLEDYGKAVALADAMFVTENYAWESLQAMNRVDGGYDVRVYDSTHSCVYAAHTRYQTEWIGAHEGSMAYSARLQKAVRFATKTHEVYQKQTRKGKDIPYITHPLTVGLILARAGAPEDVVIAGILHDTIEDSPPAKKVTKEMIAERFGDNVAALVASVTEFHKDLPWEQRKLEAIAHIKKFSHESLLVKSADVIGNLTELIDDYERIGEAVWTRFNAPKEKILENARRVISMILERWPGNPLAGDLREVDRRLNSREEAG
jgi:hypothetical protein